MFVILARSNESTQHRRVSNNNFLADGEFVEVLKVRNKRYTKHIIQYVVSRIRSLKQKIIVLLSYYYNLLTM